MIKASSDTEGFAQLVQVIMALIHSFVFVIFDTKWLLHFIYTVTHLLYMLCMYVCMFIYVYIYIYICVCVCVCVCIYTHIQDVSRLEDITAAGDFLGLCDQKSSYKHVSDFGRLRSYDRLKLRGEGNDY